MSIWARPGPAFTVPCLVRPYISTGRAGSAHELDRRPNHETTGRFRARAVRRPPTRWRSSPRPPSAPVDAAARTDPAPAPQLPPASARVPPSPRPLASARSPPKPCPRASARSPPMPLATCLVVASQQSAHGRRAQRQQQQEGTRPRGHRKRGRRRMKPRREASRERQRAFVSGGSGEIDWIRFVGRRKLSRLCLVYGIMGQM